MYATYGVDLVPIPLITIIASPSSQAETICEGKSRLVANVGEIGVIGVGTLDSALFLFRAAAAVVWSSIVAEAHFEYVMKEQDGEEERVWTTAGDIYFAHQ